MQGGPDIAATPAVYAASVNPPRRAKRMRTDELHPLAPAPDASTSAALAPGADQGLEENDTDDEEDGQAGDDDDVVPPPRRRGRKPSTVSRAARESQRRQNHSRIEKARRTKINDALAALRHLVPGSVDGDDEEQDTSGKKRRQEKEFKLEVLERTVVYVQELQERVRVLEKNTAGSVKPSLGRKRQREEAAVGSSDDSEFTPLPPPLPSASTSWKDAPSRHVSISQSPMARASNAALSAYPSPLLLPTASNTPMLQPIDSSIRTTTLPSISSWLGHVPPSPSVQPERSAHTVMSLRPQRPPTSLPTPPTSGTLGPTACATLPPTLALELPNVASRDAFPSRDKGEKSDWTPEDESAASLLLNMRTSPRDTQAQTPSSLLGMDLSKTPPRNSVADTNLNARRG